MAAEKVRKLLGSDVASFEEAFELTGHGRFNWLVLVMSGLVLLDVFMESMGMGFIIAAAQCDLELTGTGKGLVTSAAFVGIITTAFPWGYLSDRYGRRRVMLPAILASAAISIISSFSVNVWMLALLRMLVGCCVSGSAATIYAYLGEMHISSRRASALAWASIFISFTFIILPGLAWTIVPRKWAYSMGSIQFVPWRVFILFWCVPGIAASIMLALLPESPRFLLSSRGPDEALPVLAKMYGWNHKCPPEDYPIKGIRISAQSATNIAMRMQATFCDSLKKLLLLFRPPLLRCVVISHLAMFSVYMVSSGLYVWLPDVLNAILEHRSDGNKAICNALQMRTPPYKMSLRVQIANACKAAVDTLVFPISMTFGAFLMITYLLIGVFINRIGKKKMFCFTLMFTGTSLVIATFLTNQDVEMVFFIFSLCAGCGAIILASFAVDVFPTCLRSITLCTIYMFGRAGAAFGAFILGSLLNTPHCQATLICFGIFTILSPLMILLWPNPEKVREKMELKGFTY